MGGNRGTAPSLDDPHSALNLRRFEMKLILLTLVSNHHTDAGFWGSRVVGIGLGRSLVAGGGLLLSVPLVQPPHPSHEYIERQTDIAELHVIVGFFCAGEQAARDRACPRERLELVEELFNGHVMIFRTGKEHPHGQQEQGEGGDGALLRPPRPLQVASYR